MTDFPVSANLTAGSIFGPLLSYVTAQGAFGADLYGDAPYGGLPEPFGAISAQSLGSFTAVVTFSDLLDFSYAPNLEASNYSIPGLRVLAVEEYTAAAVLLATSAQVNVTYTVTVGTARGFFGEYLYPTLNRVSFVGSTAPATMSPVPVSSSKVRIVFSEPMLNNAAFTNPSNYTIMDMFGGSLTISSVTPEQPSNPVSVALSLSPTLLKEGNTYYATVTNNIQTEGGQGVFPPLVNFVFVQEPNTPILIQFDEFSGEVSDSIFGNPKGLVFFSPALNTPAPNSVIQVEEIDVCTTAFDTYQAPQPVDPVPLYTFGSGSPSGSVIGPNGAVLWAPFPILNEAKFILSNSGQFQDELFNKATDGMAVAILDKSSWNLSYVALLNNPAFVLFESGLPAPPPPATVPVTPVQFITANNLSPIPPGPTTQLFNVLSFRMVGQSSMTATLSHEVSLAASIVASSSFISIRVPFVAGSSVSASSRLKLSGAMSATGQSSVVASLGFDRMAAASITGQASVVAGGVIWVPTLLSGNVLWLRADQGITQATGVSAWADESGAGLITGVSQATGSRQPTLVTGGSGLGGQSALSFASASDQFLQSTSSLNLGSTSWTIYAAVQPTSGIAGHAFVIEAASALYALSTGGTATVAGQYVNNTAVNGGAITTGTNYVLGCDFDGNTTGHVTVNGSATTTTTFTAPSTPNGQIAIGGEVGGTHNWNGLIAEVIVYNRLLSASDQHQVRLYLYNRYGITGT